MRDGTQDLPTSSRNALLKIAKELRAGFTGRFEVECNEGGVRRLREVREVHSEELQRHANGAGADA